VANESCQMRTRASVDSVLLVCPALVFVLVGSIRAFLLLRSLLVGLICFL